MFDSFLNFKNLLMWAIIVILSVGLFNMFQDPNKINAEKNSLPFSNFLNELSFILITLYSIEVDSPVISVVSPPE